ncbi:GNAT family N-acetyltransferase [Rugosimonospora acidiphila]|uniref:GNAT family N-acetyltransferase n=1 Tax=Rugosimonospora acidiphila TaxID=556531 RepID=UPI0031EF851B
MADLTIAGAVTEDAGEVLTLQRAAYLTEGALHDDFTLPPLVETLDEIRAAITGGEVRKAVLGTRIVGTVRARLDGQTCHIGRLAVAPDLQGHGIGSRLIADVEQRWADRVARFELFTGPKSEPNIRLYRRLGYHDMPTPHGAEPLVFLEKLPSRVGAVEDGLT